MNVKDVVEELIRKREKELKRINFYFKVLKKNVRNVLGGDVKTFVFGSFVRKKNLNHF